MIPKIIHYCWFGGNPLPEMAQKCIESWKKFCPGYEIKCWDESNYDFSNCRYAEEAYRAKKWAFVSDYARFDILYNYGGIYFDTDVELIAPIEDILDRGPFFAVEQCTETDQELFVAPGLGMAASAGHPFYKEMLTEYAQKCFLNPDGSQNQTTVVNYTTKTLESLGLQNTQQIQCVDGIWIYPWDYFCPMRFGTDRVELTQNTRSIHHYSATWFSKEERQELLLRIKASGIFGEKIGTAISRAYSLPFRTKRKVDQLGMRETIHFLQRKIQAYLKGSKADV